MSFTLELTDEQDELRAKTHAFARDVIRPAAAEQTIASTSAGDASPVRLAHITAARLRELVEEGLLEREAYREPGQRTRRRYRLTPKGADLIPALVALMQWGDRWSDDHGGPVQLRHRDCGERVGVQLRCGAGHDVEPDDLDLGRNGPH